MECLISPGEIAAQIEQSWINGKVEDPEIAFQELGRLDKVDAYVAWLSKNWPHFSEAERELLIAGGAALFDAKLKNW